MTLRAITAADAQLFADRLTAESTNAGTPYPTKAVQILGALSVGDIILIDTNAGGGFRPDRVAIWLHREPSEPDVIQLPHFWCPSTRVLELFGKVCNLLQSRGFVWAEFSAEMPVGAQAKNITGATLQPNGRYRVSLANARAALTALGVP